MRQRQFRRRRNDGWKLFGVDLRDFRPFRFWIGCRFERDNLWRNRRQRQFRRRRIDGWKLFRVDRRDFRLFRFRIGCRFERDNVRRDCRVVRRNRRQRQFRRRRNDGCKLFRLNRLGDQYNKLSFEMTVSARSIWSGGGSKRRRQAGAHRNTHNYMINLSPHVRKMHALARRPWLTIRRNKLRSSDAVYGGEGPPFQIARSASASPLSSHALGRLLRRPV